jgi:isopentenyl phosphate kinase
MTVQNTSQHSSSDHTQHLGGALIDDKGREIPITEAMIQKACRELDDSLKKPARPE